MTSYSDGSGSDRGSVGTSLTHTDDRVDVGVAEYRVSYTGETLTTRGLGSCVAVALYDEAAGVGGLAHFMLPSAEDADGTGTKFVDVGLDRMVRTMRRRDATVATTVAKLAGGAHLLDIGDTGVGDRNVAAAEEALAEYGVPVVASDTDEDHSRSVELDAATGEVRVVLPDGTVRRI